MESSILTSTKKLLGLAEDYEAFDLDVITAINSSFGELEQLGVGPALGFAIDDKTAVWEDLVLPQNQLSLVKTYIFLTVRMQFDPPATSFHIEAMNKQIDKLVFRMHVNREMLAHPLQEVEEEVT